MQPGRHIAHQPFTFETTPTEKGERATAILGIIFASAAAVSAVALIVFSMGIVIVPAIAFTAALWTTAGSALAALIIWIANRILMSQVPEAQTRQFMREWFQNWQQNSALSLPTSTSRRC